MPDTRAENAEACKEVGGQSCSNNLWESAYGDEIPAGTKARDYVNGGQSAIDSLNHIFSSGSAQDRAMLDGYDDMGVFNRNWLRVFGAGPNDGAITKYGLDFMISDSQSLMPNVFNPSNFNSEFMKNAQWLRDNWDTPAVKAMQTHTGSITEESFAEGMKKLKEQSEFIRDKYNPGDTISFLPSGEWSKGDGADSAGILNGCSIKGSISEKVDAATTLKPGDGTWISAKRLLKLDEQSASSTEITALSDALAAQWKEEHGKKAMPPGAQLITDDNQYLILKRITDEALRKRVMRILEAK